MPKRKRDVCRTYCSGNERKKIKVAKETETKRVSGATKKFTVARFSVDIEESNSEPLSSLKDQAA